MVTGEELQQAIRDAEARARQMAAGFAERAGLSESDFLRADTARMIVSNAAFKAEHMRRDELDARLKELADWTETTEGNIADAALSKGDEPAMFRTMEEGIAHALAVTDAREAQMRKWIEEHPLRVWLEACDKPLGVLAEPGGTVQ